MKLFFLFLVLLLHSASIAQTIKGTITDTLGNEVSFAQIIIQQKDSSKIEQYYIANESSFSFELKKQLPSLLLTVQSLGYKKQQLPINVLNQKEIELTIKLTPLDEVLEEIIVSARRERVYEQNDTTVYNVDQFKDGTERKVQDVLKKMPGIDVNEQTGEIKYLGKSVETVMLEGDNLFDKNYTLGTKNINIDAINKVEAIKNYTENKLLKGIEGGDKVALNLKLKKGVLDLSGSATLGSGLIGQNIGRYATSNLIAIQKKLKSFAVAAHNNYGVSKSPNDYFGRLKNADQIQYKNYTAKGVIKETSWQGVTKQDDSRFNDELFGNLNTIYNISKHASAKINLYYIRDRLDAERNYKTSYQNTINTSDDFRIRKKPTQYRGDIEIKWKTSENSNLKINSQLAKEEIKTNRTNLQNNLRTVNSTLVTTTKNNINAIEYTKKIAKNKAIIVSAIYADSKRPQAFSISKQTANEFQASEFNKQVLEPKVRYLFTRKNLKGELFGKFTNSNIHFTSNNESLAQHNQLNYQNNSLSTGISGVYQFKKFKARTLLSFVNLRQNLNDDLPIQKNLQATNNFINPYLSLVYQMKENIAFSAAVTKNQNLFSEEYIYANPIQTDERTLISNNQSLNLNQTSSQQFKFLFKDWYRQFLINLSATRSINDGGYLMNRTITQNQLTANYQYNPNKTERLTGAISISKYLPAVESTVKIFGTISDSEYYNIVNASSQRKNTARIQNINLFYKTAFDGKINFENQFFINQFVSKSKATNQVYQNSSFSNRFKTISYFSKEFLLFNSYTYFKPNDTNSQVYHFLDSTARYKPKKSNWEYSFNIDNILNQKENKTILTSDYSETIQSYKILPRKFRASISYSF